MTDFCLHTPVLFLVYNRPDLTSKVFAAIREAQPRKLFVAADGPRPGRDGDDKLCEEVRNIATAVDWDCEVLTRFQKKNLGCQRAIFSAITWFFENVEEGIILEDDCLPSRSFFQFCQELLERYRDDSRIFLISGNNFQRGRKRTEYSYYFSLYNHIWGWATFRRAWQFSDFHMKAWPEIRDGRWLNDLLNDKIAVKYWEKIFQSTYDGKIDTWDFLWAFSCWIYGGLSILPNVNLVKNIGFGMDATHTKRGDNYFIIEPNDISFPLKHPPFLIRDSLADRYTQRHIYNISFIRRLKMKLRSLF